MTGKSGIFQNLWRINFSLILFEISQIFQKVWVEKLILHSFWKIQLFPVILSWIIYEIVLKTIKYISLTKSIRRENVRHIFSTWIIIVIVFAYHDFCGKKKIMLCKLKPCTYVFSCLFTFTPDRNYIYHLPILRTEMMMKNQMIFGWIYPEHFLTNLLDLNCLWIFQFW